MELGKPVQDQKLIELVKAIFKESPVVYEAYSVPDTDIRKFISVDEVMNYILERKDAGENFIHLSVFYPETSGYVKKRKIDLNPNKCNGANVRYSIDGWGLIQFQLSFNKSNITCNIVANSEKRSVKWEATYPELKSPSIWNWKLVNSHCKRLNRVLIKCA